jgi:hypothetical protein
MMKKDQDLYNMRKNISQLKFMLLQYNWSMRTLPVVTPHTEWISLDHDAAKIISCRLWHQKELAMVFRAIADNLDMVHVTNVIKRAAEEWRDLELWAGAMPNSKWPNSRQHVQKVIHEIQQDGDEYENLVVETLVDPGKQQRSLCLPHID